VRELRLSLSRAGAAYLERVGQARVRIDVEERHGRTGKTRGGFSTTLRQATG
jgi:hypothetical protein